MLSNKQYQMKCVKCGYVKTIKEFGTDSGCQKCNGFMKIIARFGKCVCGSKIEFSHFTNTCDNCNRDYNSSGQELAPREQWGEETGESLSDILSIK